MAAWRPWRLLAGGYLFGAVTINALMYLVTGNHLDETVVAGTLSAVMFDGLRPRTGDQS